MNDVSIGMKVRITKPGEHKEKTAKVIKAPTSSGLTLELRNGRQIEIPVRFVESA